MRLAVKLGIFTHTHTKNMYLVVGPHSKLIKEWTFFCCCCCWDFVLCIVSLRGRRNFVSCILKREKWKRRKKEKDERLCRLLIVFIEGCGFNLTSRSSCVLQGHYRSIYVVAARSWNWSSFCCFLLFMPFTFHFFFFFSSQLFLSSHWK